MGGRPTATLWDQCAGAPRQFRSMFSPRRSSAPGRAEQCSLPGSSEQCSLPGGTATILDFARPECWDGLKLESNGVIWDKSVVLSLPGRKKVVVAVEKVTINVTWQRRDLDDGDDGKENDEAKRVPKRRANGDMTRARQGGKKNEVATAHREAGASAEAGAGAGEGTGAVKEAAAKPGRSDSRYRGGGARNGPRRRPQNAFGRV